MEAVTPPRQPLRRVPAAEPLLSHGAPDGERFFEQEQGHSIYETVFRFSDDMWRSRIKMKKQINGVSHRGAQILGPSNPSSNSVNAGTVVFEAAKKFAFEEGLRDGSRQEVKENSFWRPAVGMS
jgi:hypothetical protein